MNLNHPALVASLADLATETESAVDAAERRGDFRCSRMAHVAHCRALVASYDRLGWAIEFGDREDRVSAARLLRAARNRAWASASRVNDEVLAGR